MSRFLTYEEWQRVVEDSPAEAPATVRAGFVLAALTEWPTALQEVDELVAALQGEIRAPLTFATLAHYAASTSDPWKVEAVDALLELFDRERTNQFDPVSDLETLLERLSRQCQTSQSAGEKDRR